MQELYFGTSATGPSVAPVVFVAVLLSAAALALLVFSLAAAERSGTQRGGDNDAGEDNEEKPLTPRQAEASIPHIQMSQHAFESWPGLVV